MTTTELVEQYRRLVGALLEHTWINHEGTELAIADFFASDDRATSILRMVVALQLQQQSEVNGVDLGEVRWPGYWVWES
jgi:hypothetical protein